LCIIGIDGVHMRPIAGERLANMARQYISKTAADWIIQIQKITLRMGWIIALRGRALRLQP
jgi:hypothetical protein